MRLPTTKNTAALEILQESDKDTSPIIESLAKLQIGDDDVTTRVLEELNRLNLDDDDSSKLIPRGPWRQDTQSNTSKPYSAPPARKNVSGQYISYNHSCGGTFTSTEQTPVASDTSNSYNYSITTPVTWDSDWIVCTCDTCKLQMVNLPEFFDFFIQECEKYDVPIIMSNDKKQTKSEAVAKAEITKPNTEFVKPQARRYSEDSGFQSDIASPFSDTVMSPKPSSTQTNESQRRPLRKILPKSDTTNSCSSSSKETSAQELLRSTLIPDIKQIKWIEVIKKSDDDIFGKDNDGRTILHKLLQSDEKYITESFYATVERMKKNPTKCKEIIESESSISDAISDDLLLDYFKESLSIMQNITN